MFCMKIFPRAAHHRPSPPHLPHAMTGTRHVGVASRIRHVENRHRMPGTDVYQRVNTQAGESLEMAEVTVVYWRDIPAQVIVGKGRRGSKVQLTERFEQAIDRCAMKIGAKDADAYLAEWRKVVVADLEGEPDSIAADYAAKLEAEFDTARIKTLIDAEGWAKA
jgi:Virulence factor